MEESERVQGCLLTDMEVLKLVGEKKEKSKSVDHKNNRIDSYPWVRGVLR